MTEPFVITVDDAKARRWFAALLQRSSDLSGLMRDIGEVLTASTKQRFAVGVGPDGIAWAPLKDGSGRTPLLRSGRMRDDIFPDSGTDWVEISAAARQAKWHQEGTDPYVIRPKGKKALAFGPPASRISGKHKGSVFPSTVVKVVNHPGLPARPFMGLSSEDETAIEALAIQWLADPESR